MNPIEPISGITPRGTPWRATWTTYKSLSEGTARLPEWVVTVLLGRVGSLRLSSDEAESRVREEVAELLATIDPEA